MDNDEQEKINKLIQDINIHKVLNKKMVITGNGVELHDPDDNADDEQFEAPKIKFKRNWGTIWGGIGAIISVFALIVAMYAVHLQKSDQKKQTVPTIVYESRQ